MNRLDAEGLRNLRLDLGLTQAQLAAEIGVHEMTISRYERGVSEPIGVVYMAFKRLQKRRDKIRQRTQ